MLYKLLQSVKKELRLLSRDFGGLIILFVMPLVLIVTVTMIQDNTFRSVTETSVPILFVDYDQGDISQSVRQNLTDSNSFQLISEYDGQPLTENTAKELVQKGLYQLAIVLPENLSNDLQEKIDQNVAKIVRDLGLSDDVPTEAKMLKTKEITLYFDPAVQLSFKNSVKNGIGKMVSHIETQSVYAAFQEQFATSDEPIIDQNPFIVFREAFPGGKTETAMPNSVQHNVPAWILFAIFFIVVPLSINLVKEKQQGTHVRLLTLPVPYAVSVAGKTITYLIICYLQFLLMLAVGYFLFPYLGLPQLQLEGTFIYLTIIALCSGLAAVGFGILIGTVADTQEQSAPFGATSVVILAAVGGVWVPVFAMPKLMQHISNISPMNWGLNAFYDILLRKGSLTDIVPEIICLLLFFAITTAIAIAYDKKKRAV
ncbi:MAG: ABC transporter permease [Capnocytophaga sp.]|nr:ABC transporter permease [Capnocytophaga sp.]